MRRAIIVAIAILILLLTLNYASPTSAAPARPPAATTTKAAAHRPPDVTPQQWWAKFRPFSDAVWYSHVLAYAAAVQHARERPSYPHLACGGNLPPCSVMWCESGGDITARNPRSSASGKWQVIDSTWHRFRGYARAYLAPEQVQDERAAQIWDGGRGARQWVCR